MTFTTYRSVWAERSANVAWWAYCNKNTDTEPQAKDALLLAQQLHDDVALHQIPLMKLIAEKSIDIPV